MSFEHENCPFDGKKATIQSFLRNWILKLLLLLHFFFLLTSFIFLDLQSSFTQFHLVFFPSCLVWQNVLLSLLKFHFTKKVYLPFCSFLQKLGIVVLQSSNFFKCWSVALDSKCILSWWMATRHELSLDEFNYELWQKLASVICVNGPHFLLWVMGYLFEAFFNRKFQ